MELGASPPDEVARKGVGGLGAAHMVVSPQRLMMRLAILHQATEHARI